jgi:hypothetical protein
MALHKRSYKNPFVTKVDFGRHNSMANVAITLPSGQTLLADLWTTAISEMVHQKYIYMISGNLSFVTC